METVAVLGFCFMGLLAFLGLCFAPMALAVLVRMLDRRPRNWESSPDPVTVSIAAAMLTAARQPRAIEAAPVVLSHQEWAAQRQDDPR